VAASLPCNIVVAACSANGSGCKTKKVNNHPRVAVMTKMAVAVVAWW